jgi:hypothetical protein
VCVYVCMGVCVCVFVLGVWGRKAGFYVKTNYGNRTVDWGKKV